MIDEKLIMKDADEWWETLKPEFKMMIAKAFCHYVVWGFDEGRKYREDSALDVKQCNCRPQLDVCPPFPLNKEEWEFPCDNGAKK